MSLLVRIKIYVQIDTIVAFGFTCYACLPYTGELIFSVVNHGISLIIEVSIRFSKL